MRDSPTDLLRALGQAEADELPLAEGALALARLDHPKADPAPYRAHLAALARDVAAVSPAPGSLEERAAALGAVLAGRLGYRGDDETYDDLANADLIRVIDRRRGLPVALGILYIHAARAQGWRAAGTAFPGHFLIRLDDGPDRLLVDPFAGGSPCDEARLAQLLARAEPGAALTPLHQRAVPDREVLLRLLNNIKTRLLQEGAGHAALSVIERMLLIAPRRGVLWRDAGITQMRLGRLAAAITAFEHAIAFAEDSVAAVDARQLLQQAKGKLN